MIFGDGKPKTEICFLPRQLRSSILPKQRNDDPLNVCWSNTQLCVWQVVVLSLSYRPFCCFYVDEKGLRALFLRIRSFACRKGVYSIKTSVFYKPL